MCDAPATSREHVPPKCLFPERSDLRKSLIKVPSCPEHNLRKSNDDELLRHVLVSVPGNNAWALEVADGGVIPAFERRPHIMKTFMPNSRLVRFGGIETAAFSVDLGRFEASIGAIVRGLFFHETQRKLLVGLQVVWGVLMTSDLQASPYYDLIQRGEEALPPINRGANPRVFQYRFEKPDAQYGVCRLRFYDGHPIYIVWFAPGEGS
jgi:hypothetical protein